MDRRVRQLRDLQVAHIRMDVPPPPIYILFTTNYTTSQSNYHYPRNYQDITTNPNSNFRYPTERPR